MTFREKIDNILKTNDLGINTVNGLEKYIGASTGSISKPYKKNEEPGPATVKKIKKGFAIPDSEWDEGDFGASDDKHLIATLERLVESKNQEILRLQQTQNQLMAMISKLTGGGSTGEQAKK